MGHSIRLMVFDVGSVLIRCGRSLAEDIEQAGFSVTAEWVAAFEKRLKSLPRRSVGAIGNARYMPLFVEASDGVFTLEDAQRISDVALIAEYPGISRVFDALEASGVETAVLSNTNDADWARLFPGEGVMPEFPTLPRARHRFGSHLLGLVKPDAKAYQAVEAGTGYSGGEILFVDDRIENVEAARSLGWMAEVIDHSGDTAAQMLDVLREHGVIS